MPDGTRGKITKTKSPIMVVLDDIFLSRGDKQLKIRFNPQLSSIKRNINEVKIDTIGSKYPFIRRNGDMNYITFPIGGLISSEMDENNNFSSKKELYGKYETYYNNYNNKYEINKSYLCLFRREL